MSGKVVPLRRPEGRVEEISDEALVAACAVGDQAALGALFDRHHQRIHRFLCRVASLSSSEGEDLLQETFTAVWKASQRYQGDAKALTWLFGIAANIARNHVRSRLRGQRAMTVLGEQPTESKEAADEIAARKEALKRLERALGELPHDHRVTLVMCDLEGTSGVDAAKVLGVRPGTVWRRLHEARHMLREKLREAEG